MRRWLLLSLCLLTPLLAADHWVRYASGPFELLTDAGERAGQDTMVRFEEFRHALGQIVGEQDLTTPEPVRILVFKNAQGWTSPAPIVEARTGHAIVLSEKAEVSPAVYGELARLLIDANTSRMPAAFEHGLVEFFSTFEVTGIHITAGVPPPKPDLDWARVHLLIVAPEYFGKLRVLLYNLRRGVDEDAAYHNAFGKGRAEVEVQAKQHFAAGNFQTTTLSSRPLAAADFHEKPIAESDVRLARADLLAPQSAAEYQALIRDHLKIPEAEEGLGLLALREHHPDEARAHFSAAMDAGVKSARCYIEYARLEPDNEKATQALLRAAGINPKLAEPFAMLAARDTDRRQRLAHWKDAAERDPRNLAYWQALAECYLAAHNYGDAAKAWRQAEQAAVDPAERERMRQARVALEGQRLDYEAAEKQRQADEETREIERLKEQARADLHAAEVKLNGGEVKPNPNAVPWWDGPAPPATVHGTLKQVDCLGKQARIVVEGADHKTIRLLVLDPAKVAIADGAQWNFTCGVQKPRRVAVGYIPKANSRTATAGEVATIEFQ
jgi:tetratricopeptide (TPR) repeat protein